MKTALSILREIYEKYGPALIRKGRESADRPLLV